MSAAVLTALAALTTVGGILAAAAVLPVARQLLPALQVGLDFWLAAGLLRIAGTPSWDALAGTGAILLIRQLVTRGLRATPGFTAGHPTSPGLPGTADHRDGPATHPRGGA